MPFIGSEFGDGIEVPTEWEKFFCRGYIAYFTRLYIAPSEL
jgi:hypothetical protein